ncbi:MAG TPA: hypothetical protein VGX76_05465 [Pirellulales bacterium]|nr:hypothetical protein [Pirellulales bacterium]
MRDLWPQKDLPAADGKVSAKAAPHGVVLVKIGKPTLQRLVGATPGCKPEAVRFF